MSARNLAELMEEEFLYASPRSRSSKSTGSRFRGHSAIKTGADLYGECESILTNYVWTLETKQFDSASEVVRRLPLLESNELAALPVADLLSPLRVLAHAEKRFHSLSFISVSNDRGRTQLTQMYQQCAQELRVFRDEHLAFCETYDSASSRPWSPAAPDADAHGDSHRTGATADHPVHASGRSNISPSTPKFQIFDAKNGANHEVDHGEGVWSGFHAWLLRLLGELCALAVQHARFVVAIDETATSQQWPTPYATSWKQVLGDAHASWSFEPSPVFFHVYEMVNAEIGLMRGVAESGEALGERDAPRALCSLAECHALCRSVRQRVDEISSLQSTCGAGAELRNRWSVRLTNVHVSAGALLDWLAAVVDALVEKSALYLSQGLECARREFRALRSIHAASTCSHSISSERGNTLEVREETSSGDGKVAERAVETPRASPTGSPLQQGAAPVVGADVTPIGSPASLRSSTASVGSSRADTAVGYAALVRTFVERTTGVVNVCLLYDGREHGVPIPWFALGSSYGEASTGLGAFPAIYSFPLAPDDQAFRKLMPSLASLIMERRTSLFKATECCYEKDPLSGQLFFLSNVEPRVTLCVIVKLGDRVATERAPDFMFRMCYLLRGVREVEMLRQYAKS